MAWVPVAKPATRMSSIILLRNRVISDLLSRFEARTHVPALEKILPSHTHCDRRIHYGEAVQSNLRFLDRE